MSPSQAYGLELGSHVFVAFRQAGMRSKILGTTVIRADDPDSPNPTVTVEMGRGTQSVEQSFPLDHVFHSHAEARAKMRHLVQEEISRLTYELEIWS